VLILAVTDHAEGHHVPGHPERPDRVAAALAGIRELDLGSSVRLAVPVPAEPRALRRVHTGDYLAGLEALSRGGGGALDPDTYVTPSSWEAALLSAGAGLAAMRELQRVQEGVGMVVSRPPGHHATRQVGMGFCLLNNVAIAAAELAEEGERVLVVDWDVHHGNGTQDIFWDDDRVLYASVHEYGIYPGTGESGEVGGDGARGLTVNVPVPPGATGDVVRAALDQVVAPVVQEFEPTWVLVSAGYDAHRADPLAGLALSSADFGDLASTVAEYAPRPGRMLLFLEGGYDLTALRDSVAATIGRLVDAKVPGDTAPTSGGPGLDWVARALRARQLLEG
jgi:acetoin utilization deacetylase AcuC-like enzyme